MQHGDAADQPGQHAERRADLQREAAADSVRASKPIGSVPSHMPNTITEIGSVARLLSGASIAPTMPRGRDDHGVVAAGERLRDRQHQRVALGEAVVDHDMRRSRRSPTSSDSPKAGGRLERVASSRAMETLPLRQIADRRSEAPGCRITTVASPRPANARRSGRAPTAISSMNRSMTWPGPSAPSAPRPHRNALPASAA